MARESSRKFTTIEITHPYSGDLELEMRVHYDKQKDLTKIRFYIDTFRFTSIDNQQTYIPCISGDSPAEVLKTLGQKLDERYSLKEYDWKRYVRLRTNLDLHHLFYHQTPVVAIEEYYFANDKSTGLWYQTATPTSPIPIQTESPPTERLALCDDEKLFSELHETARRRSDELRNKIVQLKDSETESLQRDLEIMLGLRHPQETQETNEFERILRDYSS